MSLLPWIPVNLLAAINEVSLVNNNLKRFWGIFLLCSAGVAVILTTYSGITQPIIKNFLVVTSVIFGFSLNASLLLSSKFETIELGSGSNKEIAMFDTWYVAIFSLGLGFLFIGFSLLYYTLFAQLSSPIITCVYYVIASMYIFSVGMLVRYIPSFVGVTIEE